MNRQGYGKLAALASLLTLGPLAMAQSVSAPVLIEGVGRDMAQARLLYCQAALLGDAQAQYALGWMLANGRGGGRDDCAAASLFALSAAQGHVQAAAMLRDPGAAAG